ncbi:MAG: hypothetical protein COV67_13580 [Nitrospinae bacterium CG11_big_fil_rev_8_21_14_0_20_56_8]|nr:MAG: hypothetical protein COV67_13580 [Nitrospinae bacterium CG11_big_fil_rev_8_21_14_0_20_56_8]
MEIRIVQQKTLVIPIAGRPCQDCGEEDKLRDLQRAEDVEDRVTLSGKSPSDPAGGVTAKEASGQDSSGGETGQEGKPASRLAPSTELQLTEEERRVLQELRSRDREVRSHEAAHKSAAGSYAKGGPTFEYQTGPDGRRYAVGGEVQIDSSPVPGNPRATIQKAQIIRRAANAPRNPSAQDRRVAAQAAQMEAAARRDLKEETAREIENSNASSSATPKGENTSPSGTSTVTARSATHNGNPSDSGSGANTRNDRRGETRLLQALRQYSPPASTGSQVDLFF